MPENTLEEKVAKEHAFRSLLLPQFEMREVISDKNGGLRALIVSLNPDIDNHSEGDAAFIFRGDLVDYVMKHPDLISEDLESYCYAVANGDLPIGLREIEMMSEILENPIHIYRYNDARVVDGNTIFPNATSIFGSKFGLQEPLSIYFDPVRSHFQPLKKRV